jgi:hypothetical protein
MAYDLKDVFYLDTTVTIDAATSGAGSAQLDLSAYIDPIARGRTKGTGLAIYKVHYAMTDDQDNNPVGAGETGTARIATVAGLGIGDNATGDIQLTGNAMQADNSLAVSIVDYYGPGSGVGTTGFAELMSPSEKVPYVIVRDNVCLCYELGADFVGGMFLSVRYECAQVSLDQSTLNQLLRTQTV